MILFRDETPAAAILDFQEALVAIRHAVGAANGIVIRRTDFLTATKQETLHASLHRYYVHVFPRMEIKLSFFFLSPLEILRFY